MNGLRPCLALVLCLLVLSGCARKWQRGWELADSPPAAQQGEAPSLTELQQALHHAGGQVEVLRLIAACKEHLAAGQRDRETYAMLGMLQTLMGAAYADSRAAREQRYIAAMQACEQAMALRPAFRQALEQGEPFDQAVLTLGREDIKSMFFWNTAMQYYFKECLTPLEYPFNFNWIRRSQAIQEHMTSLEPDWGDGALHFSKAVLLLGLPESLGGDMEQAHQILDRAAERWPKSLLFRWGRAKYWSTKAGDREGFVQDLNWVLQQDPAQSQQPPYPWNVYFIRDARRMLQEQDAYF